MRQIKLDATLILPTIQILSPQSGEGMKPGVLTPGTINNKKYALKGRCKFSPIGIFKKPSLFTANYSADIAPSQANPAVSLLENTLWQARLAGALAMISSYLAPSGRKYWCVPIPGVETPVFMPLLLRSMEHTFAASQHGNSSLSSHSPPGH